MLDCSLVSILPEITREDLLFFVFDEKIVYYKDFSNFCNNSSGHDGKSKLSRQTMTNYIKDLKREKKIEKGLEPNAKYPHYFVPEDKYDEVKAVSYTHLTLPTILLV